MPSATNSSLSLQSKACVSVRPSAANPWSTLYKMHPTGTVREGHVFEVDVTSGEVLNGRRKAYMLLFVMHDNEV